MDGVRKKDKGGDLTCELRSVDGDAAYGGLLEMELVPEYIVSRFFILYVRYKRYTGTVQ